MKSVLMLATLGVALQTVSLGVFAGEENAPQTKMGLVRKVDASAKQVVVMVTRELTFTVTDSTKIVQGDEAKKLADVKVGAKVTVEYVRDGDSRTAKKIVILAGKGGSGS
jgi:Cu/Ag efflux protein CusF